MSTIKIGDRFGYLTIIDKDSRPKYKSSWLCRCDCGKEVYFPSSRLLRGTARSCGCKNRSKHSDEKDLTGKRFGHLLVLSRSNNARRKSSWLCQCECGNTLEVHASALITGRRTSCGCKHLTSRHVNDDLTGRRFGHVTVISRSNAPKDKSVWHCRCDCGNEFTAYASVLLSGKYTSCGKCKYHLIKVKETMIGKRYHHLTVEDIVETEPKKFMLLCRCDCGNQTLATTYQLTNGYKRSCGCNLNILKRVRKPLHRDLTAAQKLKTNDAIRYHKAHSNTGFKGVHKRERLKTTPYEAAITCQGVHHYLGQFPTLEDAVQARLLAEEKYFQPLIEQLDKSAKDNDIPRNQPT